MSLSLFLFCPDLKCDEEGECIRRVDITDGEKWYVFSYNAFRKKTNALSSILFPLLSFSLLYTYTAHECTLTHKFFLFDIVFYNEPDLYDGFIHRYKQHEWKQNLRSTKTKHSLNERVSTGKKIFWFVLLYLFSTSIPAQSQFFPSFSYTHTI